MNVQHPQHPFPRKFTSLFTTFSPGSLHEKIALTVSCFYFAWLSLQSGSRVHVLLYRVLRSVDNNVSFQDLPVRNPVILLQKMEQLTVVTEVCICWFLFSDNIQVIKQW